eukprot:8635162-Pyramimonas_sp.AAC.1
MAEQRVATLEERKLNLELQLAAASKHIRPEAENPADKETEELAKELDALQVRENPRDPLIHRLWPGDHPRYPLIHRLWPGVHP